MAMIEYLRNREPDNHFLVSDGAKKLTVTEIPGSYDFIDVGYGYWERKYTLEGDMSLYTSDMVYRLGIANHPAGYGPASQKLEGSILTVSQSSSSDLT